MDRRAFLGTLGLRAPPPGAVARHAAQTPRIGFLWGGTPTPSLLREKPSLDVLKKLAAPSACR